MKTNLYFAYGSNLDADQMRRRCPGAAAEGPAKLPRHRMVFAGHSVSWGGGVANVRRHRASMVEGMLYRLGPEDLEALDRFEGHPFVYDRVVRYVVDEKGRRRRAQVYVSEELDLSPPSLSYFKVLDRAYTRLQFDRMPLASATLAALHTGRNAAARVFVYGTLRAGQGNHRLLASARWLGLRRSAPFFRLVDLGSFPAMLADGAGSVTGELYEVDAPTLAALDRLEGHPDFYERTTIALEDGTEAQAYLLPASQVEARPVIASGDWLNKRRFG